MYGLANPYGICITIKSRCTRNANSLVGVFLEVLTTAAQPIQSHNILREHPERAKPQTTVSYLEHLRADEAFHIQFESN